jgi:pyruvate/2-oxoglutarate/acetoin dehydrogenase E1 component
MEWRLAGSNQPRCKLQLGSGEAPVVSERFLVEAINDALHLELERDGEVMVMGEDVGRAGGVFRATAGLRDRFGPDRCVDTPLAEAGILGTAVGLCMAGWRPVCEMQYDAFSYPCLDQLITHVGRYRWRSGGTMEFPLVVRMPYGGGVRAPELHDDSPETYYVHTPGVKVAIPSTPADAKGLLAAAIRDPDPVVVLEPKLIYRTERAEVPDGEHVVPLGQACIARDGNDVTLVAYGAMVPLCERVADTLAGEASIEVLDLRTLKPLDEDTLLASAAKTGRVVIVQEAPRTAGFGAEIAAILAEKAILDLQGPVLRVTGYDVPYPYWKIEDAYMPSVERVVDAVRKLLEF